MARYVPLARRRDLKPPAYLHLDPGERFPRVTVEGAPARSRFGPFRDRKAAGRAVHALHKVFPLRPCDYVFEPDPALPLGLGCVYAQVRSCAAPCLARVGEDEYRALAAKAAAFLDDPGQRGAEHTSWLPSWVSEAAGLRGLVVEHGRAGAELYPVAEGSVLEEQALLGVTELQDAAARLRWTEPPPDRDDRPWLVSWLHTPRRPGHFLVLAAADDDVALAARLRALGGA